MLELDAINVLVVDDNPDDAELLIASLTDAARIPVKCTHVGTHGAAIDVLQKEAFMAALYDVRLPEGSNGQGIPELQAVRPSLAVIAVSGPPEDILAQNAFVHAADDSVHKGSVTGAELYRVVCHAIRRRQHWTQMARTMATDAFELFNTLNGRYTSQPVCNERHKWLKWAIAGLYGLCSAAVLQGFLVLGRSGGGK